MDKEPSEIVKLTERISKDPKSKLFVPLAEEYKKTGDIEMAVYVLTEGLKNNPGYITARSFLGRLLLEKGDLAGSQQELEEVVKAIPDNLLAQRKLGDLYILQNIPSEALKHYKSALSLNSRDEEIASLISDLEAGRDVSTRIHQPQLQPSPEKPAPQAAKQQPQAAPLSAPVAAPVARVSHPEKAEAIKISVVAPTPAHQPVVETEEPEEVFFVESLDNEPPVKEPHADGLDFLTEQSQAHTPAPSQEEPHETLFASTGQLPIDLPKGDQTFPEPDVLHETIAETLQPVASEEPISAEIIESEFVDAEIVEAELVEEEPVAMPPVEAAEEASDKTDDFRTDTLAELYIAQGFFEKAIDIYEQMLADNPNSKGLKDKLERVKAMAAASAAPAEEKKTEADIFAEPQVYRAQKEEPEEKKPVDLFGQPEEYTSAAGAEERQQGGIAKEMPLPAKETTRAKPAFTDFEPREYVPPQAEPVEPEPVGATAQKTHAAPKSPKASRKETIDRLESWLKNIKKES
jgi:tetratricopeptide (TPR) repeat protein